MNKKLSFGSFFVSGCHLSFTGCVLISRVTKKQMEGIRCRLAGWDSVDCF